MKKITSVLFMVSLFLSSVSLSAQELIISEVVDATLPGGLPKFVELTNIGDVPIDLSEFSIGNFSNGGTTLGGGTSTVLSGSLAPSESYVISCENGDGPGSGSFFNTYGFDPDNFDLGSFINGDDVIALFQGPATGDGSDATLIDLYGVIGVNGDDEVWDYTDGFGVRNTNVTSPNASFTPAEWSFGGANSLETGDDVTELALILANTTPGTFGDIAPLGTTLSIAADNAVRAEGDTGTTDFTFIVTRSGDVVGTTNVDFGVTGDVDASDFGGTLPSGTLSFMPEQTSQTITVSVSGDTEDESDEMFTVTLSNATNGATIQTASADGIVQNDDSPGGAVSIVINEILFDPAPDLPGDANGDGTRDGSEDEFIELVNMGADPLDISGWTISDLVQVRHTFPTNTILNPMQAIVVFGGGTPVGSFSGAVVQTASGGFLGLNNGGDTVTLNNGTADIAMEAYSNTIADESTTRDPDLTGSFIGHSSASSSGGALFSPGTRIDGTPFSGNSIPLPSLVFNELRISSSGASDDDSNYLEIFGNPNVSLDGLSLVAISGEFAPGQVDFVFDLTGFSTDANGFFLLANPTITSAIPQAELEGTDVTSDFDFFGSPSSFLIVSGFTAPQGTDLDSNDDGIFDSDIGMVIDAVSLVDGDANTDVNYGTLILGPDSNGFPPAGIARDIDGTGSYVQLVFNDLSADTPGFTNVPDVVEPGEITEIYTIQGEGHTSPLLNNTVTTTGIVTVVDTNGFYLQDPLGDDNIATSDAIFVFTGGAPTVTVGDELQVTGTVDEFFPGGVGSRNLSTTQISNPSISTTNAGVALPVAQIIGSSGRVPPTQNIDDDAFGAFEPTTDGIDFFESMEAMLVTAEDVVAIAPTNGFGEIFTVVNQGLGASVISERGTLNISPDDFNPEKIQIDEDTGILDFDLPLVNVGATLGNVTGVMGYSFGNFEILPTVDFSANVQNPTLNPETTSLVGTADQLTITSYNVLNLDPNDADGDTDVADGRFTSIAMQIVNNLMTPDIIGLQEVQDNNGSTDDGTTAANNTLQALVDAIVLAGGIAYEFIDNTLITNNQSGGQPGGNIRTAFLYNPNRVALVDGSVQALGGQGSGEAFNGARLPLVATFLFNGQQVTIVNNHFSSKGGSAPILGVEQDFASRQEDVTVNGSLDERRAQSQAVQDFVDAILTTDVDANIVVLGDLNEFEFISPVLDLETDSGLVNLTNNVNANERYSFIFQGNSQQLDHILVSSSLNNNPEVDIVHVNSEFPDTDSKASDHDPVVALLTLGNTTASFNLQITEIWSGQEGDDITADWFEITNEGTAAWVSGTDPDLFYDDESADPEAADPVLGITQIDPGQSVIVVIGDDTDATTFTNVWGPVIDLTNVQVGSSDGAGLGGGGDAVNLFVGTPALATLVDSESYPDTSGFSGVSYHVNTQAFSEIGLDGAVATLVLGGTNGLEPAVGSPGNGDPINVVPTFDLVFSEIMFNPASPEDNWEWVELYNAGDNTIDLSGFVIDDFNGVAHVEANIVSGSIEPGETAVLYNADDVSETDFIAAWGLGMNLIAVGNWQALSLNNGGDTIGLWESFASYEGDNESQINAIISVAYPNIDDGSGSIFLTDLTDGDSFALSTDGLASPAGGPAYISRMMGGNSGSDIGSPGGFISSVETPIASNPGFFQFAGGLSGLSGAEITAFDPLSNRLFVVDGSASLQIFDFSDPTNPTALGVIDVSGFGSAANSVSIRNGIVAVAIAAEIETDLGTVAFYKASDGMLLDSVVVGALPDFVTFTKNGTQALVANEGQPNGDIDPDGSVSVIDFDGTTVTNIATADFDSFDAATLRAAGVRIFPGKTVAQDVEPEYIALSDDGTTAFVALQENNAIAVVTIATATISEVRPLGTQDHSIMGNELDASDRDDIAGNLRTQPLFGLYQPDAIATFTIGTETYTITANEGDARSEDERVGNLILDPTAFPNAATLQLDENLGRILVSTIDGDIDNDGDFDQLFSYGSRSFTIRDAAGDIVFDSGNQLEAIAFANVSDPSGFDGRSDNKGPEPEGVTVGTINDRTYAFIGLERAEGVAVYDVTVPSAPIFVQYLTSPGDSEPEGLTFVEAADSPNGANLLIVANEDSNTISVYSNGAQQALTLTEFILVNADTNTDIMEINEGMVINLASLPTKNLAIRAEGTDDIESVSFQLSGPQNQINTENFEPYALFGDNTGNFAANQFLLGKYDLVAIPFSEDDLGGLAGNPLSLSFEFIEADVPNLQITEIWPGNTNGSNLTADWFEITNNGAGAWTPDIGVLAFDDDSQDVTTADVISGITSIQPGETVIAIDDSNITEFLEVWASVYDLTDVQIGTYDGPGLSGNGDGVTLFVNGEIVDFEAYPASTNGASYDVGLSAFSEVGVGPNLPVATTILSDLGEPAIGSPGNQGPTGDTGMLSIVSFTLVDANTNQDILNVIDGDSINLANLPTSFINIRANTSNDAMSVRFVLTGEINSIGTENVEPYALFGDIGGNYRGRTLLSGNYSLTVTAFSEEDLQGMEGTPITINFEVFEDNQPQIPQVIGFTLVDADTDEDMLDLVDGMAINLTELPNTFANIRANTSMGTMSVRLQLSGAQNQDMTENVAPYALFGDNAGDYRGNTFIVGNYTLTATAFSEDNLDGLSGNPLTINFEIFEEIIVPSGQAQVNTLSIYPNPAKVTINASFETPSEIEQIMVFDMIGRLVQTYDAKRIKEGNAYRLDVDSLPSGNYILKTLDKRGNSSQKQMVIEK